jgi:putative membrane protein
MTMMMWGYGYGWPMLWMVFWNLLWLVLLGLLIWGVVRWLAGRTSHPAGHDFGSPPRSALDILQERYARGEIDETTFERMRERLVASSTERQPRSTEDSQIR